MTYNCIKTSTTAAAIGTGNATVASAAAARARPLSDIPNGKQVALRIEDESGTDWELSLCTILTPTTFSRDTVLNGSSGPGVKVNFGAGAKAVQCVLVAEEVNALVGVYDIAFAQTIPLSRVGSSYMPQTAVSSALTFTPAAGAVRGALAYLRLVADGVNAPAFSGFKEWGGSIGYDNRNGIVNQIQFFCDGADSWYSVSQAVNAAPIPVPASAITLTGPTSGAVSQASSAFTIGVSPVGSAITGTIVVTPNDGGAGGSFSPATVSLTTANPSATVTYAANAAGAKTISVTNNGGLTNPSSITYTASVANSQTGSGSGNPLSLTNATFNASGKFGSSLSGGYGLAANLLPASGPVTVEFWAKTTTAAVQAALGCSYGLWVGTTDTGKATAHYGGDSGGTPDIVINSNVTVNDGAYHHFSLNIDPQGTGSTLYIDGALAGSNTTRGTISTSAPFGVRAFGGNTGFNWSGEIDEVAIYSGIKRSAAFTPSAVAVSSTEGGLIALWRLDGNGNDSNAIASTTYARLNSLNNVTENGAGPYTYQGRAGNWLNGAGGVSKVLPAGTDGSVAFGVNALASDIGMLISVTSGSTKVPYSGTLMAVYIDTQSDNKYNVITNGDAGGRVNSGVTAQVGDILRLRRAGSSFVAEIARAGAPTSFASLYTWSGQTTGAVYFQVDVSGANAAAQNVTTMGIS
ncbi:hypothetical protein HH212_26210 [Massilia forsythiae]|uniref:LamG-like jellyroll fold domain-containing protein n=1 Tax=Massilia forsythiae TaxID=2728020 RepID=A0A7Z2W0S7_9BURK|nr:LamG domain-containing protein [Massilia forsythiae]QJE03053.1 hypothetical protein HH212_26210 [Massilia forsythiae]